MRGGCPRCAVDSVGMDVERLEQVTRHLARLETRWASAVVPLPRTLWTAMSIRDRHHRLGYLAPGRAGVGAIVVFCPAVIVARTRALDDFWFDDYLCSVETHLTLHAESRMDEDAVREEMARLAPDSSFVAMLVEASA